MSINRVAVIGAGFGGVCVSILLARAGFSVDLYERQERIGKKILLTGNGRCNLSNVSVDKDHYLCPDTAKLEKILGNMSYKERDDFYESLGLGICVLRDGLYPISRQASSVLDVLRFTLSELGVTIILEKKAEAVTDDGRIVFSDGKLSPAKGYDAFIVACGGKAGVYSEEKENGFGLLKKLGHSINDTYPALTYLKCEEDIKSVAGVRCDALITLKIKDKIYRESGELQFTKEALSGIPVFQLSRYVKDVSACRVSVDFLSFLSEPETEFKRRIKIFKDRDLEGFFSGWLNKKLALYLIKRAGYKAGDKVYACDCDRLYKISRNCSFKIKAGGSYREAQLMCGGIPLNEVDEDLQSEKAKGVYLIGELLDVAGECGGYNLHFALSCAFTVSKALIRRR